MMNGTIIDNNREYCDQIELFVRLSLSTACVIGETQSNIWNIVCLTSGDTFRSRVIAIIWTFLDCNVSFLFIMPYYLYVFMLISISTQMQRTQSFCQLSDEL